MPGGGSYGGIELREISSTPLDEILSDNPTTKLQRKGYNACRVEEFAALIE